MNSVNRLALPQNLVRAAAGADLVLKVAWPHPEAAREADGLRAWAGQGAVRLHAAHDFGEAHALLIERCRLGTELSGRPEPEQDTAIAALLRRLWIPPGPGHRFPSLALMCQQWAGRFEQNVADGGASPLDPGWPARASRPRKTAQHRPVTCRDTQPGRYARMAARRILACRSWIICPGQAQYNKAPSTYEVEGALSAAPYQVGQLPGLPCTAGLPPGPGTRGGFRFPGLSHVPEFPPVVPVSGR